MAQEQHTLHPHPRTLVRAELKNVYIDALLAGMPLAKRVINVHSITGMGKTWLGYLIFAETALKPSSMAVWISFEQSEDKLLPPVKPATPIVRVDNASLLEQLSGQPFHKRLNLQALATLADSIGDSFTLHYRLAPEAEPDGPLLLFFDGLNNLIKKEPEQSASIGSHWEYTEKQVLEPIAQQTNTLTFCFSHAPLVWNSYRLREVGEAVDLAAMSRDEVRELLQQHHLFGQVFEDFVYDVSQGHPWTIQYLLLEDPGLLKSAAVGLQESASETPASAALASSISKLPPEYRDLLATVGILRLAEVAAIEALLKALASPEVRGRPVTRQLIRGALAAYGDAGLFETSSSENRTRFAKALRRMTEQSIEPERLRNVLIITAEYYYSRVFSPENITISDRLRALREWFYFQLQLVSSMQLDESNLRAQIDDLTRRVAEALEHASTYLGETFNLPVAGVELWSRSGVLHDPEIKTMLRALGLMIDARGHLAPVDPQPIAQRRPRTLDARYYSAEVVAKQIPRIIIPYGLDAEDLQPLVWIAEHKDADEGITLETLREAYRGLGRPDPRRSLLRYHLSRYTAANIVRYDYEKNVYYLDDWLRSILSRSMAREGDTTGVEG